MKDTDDDPIRKEIEEALRRSVKNNPDYKNNGKSLIALVTLMSSFIIIFIQLIGSAILSIFGLLQFMRQISDKTQVSDMVSAYHLFSFYSYWSIIIPIITLILSDFCYSRMNPNDGSILVSSAKKTFRTLFK